MAEKEKAEFQYFVSLNVKNDFILKIIERFCKIYGDFAFYRFDLIKLDNIKDIECEILMRIFMKIQLYNLAEKFTNKFNPEYKQFWLNEIKAVEKIYLNQQLNQLQNNSLIDKRPKEIIINNLKKIYSVTKISDQQLQDQIKVKLQYLTYYKSETERQLQHYKQNLQQHEKTLFVTSYLLNEDFEFRINDSDQNLMLDFYNQKVFLFYLYKTKQYQAIIDYLSIQIYSFNIFQFIDAHIQFAYCYLNLQEIDLSMNFFKVDFFKLVILMPTEIQNQIFIHLSIYIKQLQKINIDKCEHLLKQLEEIINLKNKLNNSQKFVMTIWYQNLIQLVQPDFQLQQQQINKMIILDQVDFKIQVNTETVSLIESIVSNYFQIKNPNLEDDSYLQNLQALLKWESQIFLVVDFNQGCIKSILNFLIQPEIMNLENKENLTFLINSLIQITFFHKDINYLQQQNLVNILNSLKIQISKKCHYYLIKEVFIFLIRMFPIHISIPILLNFGIFFYQNSFFIFIYHKLYFKEIISAIEYFFTSTSNPLKVDLHLLLIFQLIQAATCFIENNSIQIYQQLKKIQLICLQLFRLKYLQYLSILQSLELIINRYLNQEEIGQQYFTSHLQLNNNRCKQVKQMSSKNKIKKNKDSISINSKQNVPIIDSFSVYFEMVKLFNHSTRINQF